MALFCIGSKMFVLVNVLSVAQVTTPAPDPCVPSPCGVNADCTIENSIIVCRCSPPFVGNPFIICERKYCSYIIPVE